MSTIVVVAKDDIAAIAADSLTTWGGCKESADYIVNHQKIIQVGESYLAISGPTSAKLAVKAYFNGKQDANLSTPDAIFKTWLELHTALKNVYFLNPIEDRNDAFESSQIDVLIANGHGIFGVERHRTVQQFPKYYAYGTGWQHALGAMYAMYGHSDQPAEPIARIGIEAAAEFDVDTCIPIELYCLRLRNSH